MLRWMKTKRVDYIIVGQGLVGSAVVLQLLKRNKRILVIDQQLRQFFIAYCCRPVQSYYRSAHDKDLDGR